MYCIIIYYILLLLKEYVLILKHAKFDIEDLRGDGREETIDGKMRVKDT